MIVRNIVRDVIVRHLAFVKRYAAVSGRLVTRCDIIRVDSELFKPFE